MENIDEFIKIDFGVDKIILNHYGTTITKSMKDKIEKITRELIIEFQQKVEKEIKEDMENNFEDAINKRFQVTNYMNIDGDIHFETQDAIITATYNYLKNLNE